MVKKGAEPCPKCGNSTLFTAYSNQCYEDGCEVWVACFKCGYDPTENLCGHRLESVMGGTDNDNVAAALVVWNDEIREQQERCVHEGSATTMHCKKCGKSVKGIVEEGTGYESHL